MWPEVILSWPKFTRTRDSAIGSYASTHGEVFPAAWRVDWRKPRPLSLEPAEVAHDPLAAIVQVRDGELASYLRIEERELEAGRG